MFGKDSVKKFRINTKKERDILKNNILSKYNIPLIRLTTNGSREESIIRSKLDEIVDNNIYTYIFLVWRNVLINDKSI